ncbi:MAG TPA: cell shape determination protein CcmA [Gallionella sp.]|nr:polymer-forming cytoskeletal protein [Gallionella sp.]OGS66288.1 MAG: cell shape determination protein CcmA [Gallionellales bacterium GWA2_54_124]OGT19044.1 MAG: cell shape determination protein CcmA [Gallionellales bacterium RIFOXYD12_FULL_53_10]OGT23181.1 MAG: cell shape determination protein CcmA [Gallionellales bacterium RIFOXYD2_FULL_52_7]HCI52761.1 cell shape determination protein CcmA [Gallionella sp.]
MFNKKHSRPQSRIDTLIGLGTVIDGNVTFSGGMRIDGQINGDVIAMPGKPSTLILSELGSVNGAVSVTHLVVNGAICGNVTATEYLELHAKARVSGDVHYKTLEIQIGAMLQGHLVHTNAADQESVVTFKSSNA